MCFGPIYTHTHVYLHVRQETYADHIFIEMSDVLIHVDTEDHKNQMMSFPRPLLHKGFGIVSFVGTQNTHTLRSNIPDMACVRDYASLILCLHNRDFRNEYMTGIYDFLFATSYTYFFFLSFNFYIFIEGPHMPNYVIPTSQLIFLLYEEEFVPVGTWYMTGPNSGFEKEGGVMYPPQKKKLQTSTTENN